jgi:tetratricopeptide (TPR) repeat protein
VAYGSLLLERRRVLHACLVEALEALAPERVGEQVERLAHHAVRGEVWAKAVTYGQQAGARAYDRAAFREALAAFEQALQALAHLPEDGDTGVRAVDLRLALGFSLVALGEYGRQLALLGEAEARARALDDRARLVQVLAQMTIALRATGDFDGAITAGQQALALANEQGDSVLQMQAALYLGLAYYNINDFGRAAELLWRNVEAVDRGSGTLTLSTDMQIRSRAWLARTLSMLGAFAEGRRHGEEALRQATRDGRGETPIVAHTCLGQLYLDQGDLEHAIRVFDQGLALPASGYRDWLRNTVAGLGSYMLPGAPGGGRTLLGVRDSIHRNALQYHTFHLTLLSEVCRLEDAGMKPGSTRVRRSTWPGSRRHAGRRRSRCTSLAPSRPTPPPPMSRRPKPTTSRPWPWPKNWACAHSRPTATTDWAGCTARPASGTRPVLL